MPIRFYKASDEINDLGKHFISLCSEQIQYYINLDFEKIHLSGNLANTMYEDISSGLINIYSVINIPATVYNIAKYKKEGVISYQAYKGSYAFKVNSQGGFSRKHKNYVERSIKQGIEDFVNSIDNQSIDGYDISVHKISWRL